MVQVTSLHRLYCSSDLLCCESNVCESLQVYTRTSEYDRQSESAQWVIAGLYAGSKPWANDSMPVHPRNVHSVPYEQDNVSDLRTYFTSPTSSK